MQTRHFLTLLDFSNEELQRLIRRAIELKAMQKRGEIYEPMKNKVLGMVFEKSSTRTRVSFEAGAAQFGGHAIFRRGRCRRDEHGHAFPDERGLIGHDADERAAIAKFCRQALKCRAGRDRYDDLVCRPR